LVTTWTSAAIGEEAVFRGYLFNRLTDLFGASRVGWTIALIGQALAFGSIHAYQGIAGMAAATLFGLLSGLLYLANQRNLWLTVITHGLIDTASFLLTFVGMS
jgi:membrane protease YdiL (CAAX protease family)